MKETIVVVNDIRFKFKSLGSQKQMALGVKLIKHIQGVLPSAKDEVVSVFQMRGQTVETASVLSALFASASTIDTLIRNIETQKLQEIVTEVKECISVEVELGSEGEPVFMPVKTNDYFDGQLGLQFQVIFAYLEWAYADFFVATIKDKFAKLRSWMDTEAKKIKAKMETSKASIPATGSSTGSSAQNLTGDKASTKS